MTLRLLDTFSGIGGFSYAAERLVGGYQTVAFVEREPFCQSILRKHWPTVPIHDDITTFQPQPGSADVVCGGFPCQDISTAGKQAGIKEGTRSGLFYELMRVVRLVGPRYVVLENVAAITSNGMDCVLGTLAEAGFDAEWACIPASAVGACHRRDRWWLVAYASGTDRGRRPEGTGRGQRGQADADGCRFPEGGRGAEQLAYTSQLFGNGSSSEQHWQSSRQPLPKPGNGDRRTSPDDTASRRSRAGAPSEHAVLLADANQIGSCGLHLPLPSLCGDDAGREAVLGAGGRTGAQQRQNWPARCQPLNPDWRSYVSQPVLRRGDDGLSGRVDRLKALGNAVVPQVAAIPLARVLELERVRAANPAAHPPCP